jgi:hypothetical protein
LHAKDRKEKPSFSAMGRAGTVFGSPLCCRIGVSLSQERGHDSIQDLSDPVTDGPRAAWSQ